MPSLRKIILVICVFIALVPLSRFAIDYYYQHYIDANNAKNQSRLVNLANRLAVRFIADYDEGRIDSVVYQLRSYRCWSERGEWQYRHTFFGKETFASYVDYSQMTLVEQDYYLFRTPTMPIGKFFRACDSTDQAAFNKIRMIRKKYLLNEISNEGRVFNFDNGISYFRGYEGDLSISDLPAEVREKAAKVGEGWYKIPKPGSN